MKVYNLGCEHDHRFEGWFGSADDFVQQQARGLLECPLCASRDVRRLPSAPRLNLSGAAAQPAPAAPQADRSAAVATPGPAGHDPRQDPRVKALQAAWLQMARHVMATTEDVGQRFVDEARRIHYQEAPQRAIRGAATPEQAAELADEGIEVFALPLHAALKEPLQ